MYKNVYGNLKRNKINKLNVGLKCLDMIWYYVLCIQSDDVSSAA